MAAKLKPRTIRDFFPEQPSNSSCDDTATTSKLAPEVIPGQSLQNQEKEIISRTLEGMSTIAIQPYTSCCKIITTLCHESQNGVVIGIYPLADLLEEENSKASSNFGSCRMKCISKDTSKMERVEIITKAEDGDLLMLTPQMLETVVGNVSFPKVAFAYISEAHFVSELCSFSPVYYRITKLLEKLGTSCILALSTVASIHTARIVANILGISEDSIMYKPPTIPKGLRLSTLKEVDVEALAQLLRQPDLKDRKVILYCESKERGKNIIEQLSISPDEDAGRKKAKRSHGKSNKRRKGTGSELACYFSSMSSADKKKIREEFARGEKKVIITPLATGGALRGANTTIHCSVPQSYESLLQGSTVEGMPHIYISMDEVPEAACGSGNLDVPRRDKLKKFLRSLCEMQQKCSSTVEFRVVGQSGIKVKSVQAIFCIMESENLMELLSPISVRPGEICKIKVTTSEEKLETLCDSICERMTNLAGAQMEMRKQLYEDIRLVSDDRVSTQELFVTKLIERFTVNVKKPAISLSSPSTGAETPKPKEVTHTCPPASLRSSTPSTAIPTVSSAQSSRKRRKKRTGERKVVETPQEDEVGLTPSKRSRQYKNEVYTRVSLKRDKIIRFLAADVSPGELADKLLVVGLIGENVRDKALVTSIPVYDTIRPMIDAVLSRIELNGEIYDKFIGVLRQFQSFDDLIQFIERPEQ